MVTPTSHRSLPRIESLAGGSQRNAGIAGMANWIQPRLHNLMRSVLTGRRKAEGRPPMTRDGKQCSHRLKISKMSMAIVVCQPNGLKIPNLPTGWRRSGVCRSTANSKQNALLPWTPLASNGFLNGEAYCFLSINTKNLYRRHNNIMQCILCFKNTNRHMATVLFLKAG